MYVRDGRKRKGEVTLHSEESQWVTVHRCVSTLRRSGALCGKVEYFWLPKRTSTQDISATISGEERLEGPDR